VSHISSWDSTTFLGGSSRIAEMVICHLSCHQGASPGLLEEDLTRHQQTAWSGRGSSSWWVGVKAWDAQWKLVRLRNQQGEGSTTHQSAKNPGSNLGLPQEAEGETDHLPETASNHLLGWSCVSQVQGAGQKYCVMWKCVRHPQELGGLNFLRNSHNQAKGQVTKIQFQRGRLTREQMHHLPFHWIAL
jgi:hypothetical protein